MIAQSVRFKSGLSDEQVLTMYEAPAPRYRTLRGLIQKYYLRFPTTGEHGAVSTDFLAILIILNKKL